MGAAFTKVLDIAQSIGDPDYQPPCPRGHVLLSHRARSLPFCVPIRARFHDLTMSRTNLNDRLLGERMLGSAKHFLGDHIGARRDLEQVLLQYGATDYGRDVIRFEDIIRFQTDVQFSARVFLTRVLWVLGLSDQATGMVEKSLEEAHATGHAMSQCYALALSAGPISLWTGNLNAARHYTTMLLDLSRKHGLSHWATYGSMYQKVIDLRGGDAGSSWLRAAGADEIVQSNSNFRSLTGLSELAEALGRAGRGAEGLAVLDQWIDQSEAGWIAPELLRLRGELLWRAAPANAKPSEDLFRQALDLAHQQAALSWELRAATSFARLLSKQSRHAEAIVCLQPVYDRFTEGFGTADLIAANRLLDELSGARRG